MFWADSDQVACPSPSASTFLMIAYSEQAYNGLNSNQHNTAIILKSGCVISWKIDTYLHLMVLPSP